MLCFFCTPVFEFAIFTTTNYLFLQVLFKSFLYLGVRIRSTLPIDKENYLRYIKYVIVHMKLQYIFYKG